MFPGFQSLPEGQIIAFALVFLRVVSFMVSWPIFGTALVPSHVKVLLAVTFSMVVFPSISFQNAAQIKIDDQLVLMVFREACLGVFLGFMLRFIFFAVQVAGEIMGTSTGLAAAQILNPTMGTQGNVLEQYHLALVTLIALTLNGHHMFIEGLAKSFELAPIGAIGFKTEVFSNMALMVRDIFVIGIKMAAPLLVSMFILNLTMGLIGRAVPQMNVLMTGLQVTILVGLFVIIISTPLFVEEVTVLLTTMANKVFATMKVI